MLWTCKKFTTEDTESTEQKKKWLIPKKYNLALFSVTSVTSVSSVVKSLPLDKSGFVQQFAFSKAVYVKRGHVQKL